MVSQGIPVQISDQLLRTFSTGSIWLFRFNFVFAIALAAALHVVLFHTRFGTAILATGGNLNAARAMGINVPRTKTLAYVISGSTAGITAVMLIAFIGAAQPAPSTQFLLSAIASVVLGGVSLFGGRRRSSDRHRCDLPDGPLRRADPVGVLGVLPAARGRIVVIAAALLMRTAR